MSGFLRKISVFLVIVAACFAGARLYAAGGSSSNYYYTLDDGDAKVAAIPHSFVIGSVTQLSSLPYKPGYGYAGHYTAQNCSGTKVIDYQGNVLMSLNASTTLYACWLALNPIWNTPLVVLSDAGGSGGAFASSCGTDFWTGYVSNESVSWGHRGDWAYIDMPRSGGYWWSAPCTNNLSETTTMASIPTRSGYTFRGYYTGQNGTGTQVVYQDGSLVDANTLINVLSSSQPTTIYAYWQVDNSGDYLITLNDAGGSGGQVASSLLFHLYEIYGECYASASGYNYTTDTLDNATCVDSIYAAPTKTGYEFGGYYTGRNGSGTQIIDASRSIVGSNTQFTSAATIYAKWTPKVLTITLNHSSPTNSPSPSTAYLKYGVGWYSNSAATASLYSMVTVPQKTNYTFGGYWTGQNGTGTRVIDTDGNFIYTTAALTAVSSNATVYAYWTSDTANPVWATVTIDDQSATTNSSPTVLYRNINSNVANCSGYKASQSCGAANVTSITPPTKTNYTYGGHWTNSGGTGTQWTNSSGTILYNVTSDVTVYANWTSNAGTVYTISLDPNTGGDSLQVIYERNNVGWFRDSNGSYQITSSIFDSTSSGGAGLTKPTLSNKVFLGYFTSGGTQVIDADGYIIGNPEYASTTRLYANWADITTSAVKLMPNGGTACEVTSVTATYGSPMPTVSCAPTRTNYVFTGYFDAISGGTQYYTDELESARNWDKTGAQRLYAQWEAIPTYNVYYYCDKTDIEEGGDGPSYTDTGILYGSDYVFKTRAQVGCSAISGKKFLAWTLPSGESQWQPGQIIQYTYNSDMHIVAYNMDIGTVTLNHNGPDNSPSPSTVYLVPTDAWYSDSAATTEISEMTTAPIKYGYDFGGYYTASSSGTQIIDGNGDFINVPASGLSDLYAQYEAKKYTFTLDDVGATTASSPSRVVYNIENGWKNTSGTTITSITKPTKTGNSFAGFYTGPNGTGNMVINESGTFVTMTSTILMDFDENAVDTLYAKWNPQSTVTFSCENQAGDGSGTPNPTTVQIADGETLTFPALTNCSWGNAGMDPYRWGVVVNGNFTDTHGAGDTITWDSSWGNRTYNVWYAPNYFNYEYSCGTGSGTAPASGNTYYHNGAWTTATNTCTKTGYTFAGWLEPVSDVTYAENSIPGVGSGTQGWLWAYDVTGDAGGAFVAQWTPNTYTISYSLNGGGGGANAPTSGTYDSVVNISNPTHSHATFTGWTITGMDNGVTHYYGTSNPPTSTTTGTSITTPTKATYYKNLRSASGTVTFTAVWECDAGYMGTSCDTLATYNLTWGCGDGSGTPSGATFPTTITYGGTLTFPANTVCVAPTGYDFAGWTVDVNTTTYQPNATLTWNWTSDSEINATFEPQKVNITYSCGTGATGTAPAAQNNIDYGSSVTLRALGNCVKTGHTATKWVVSNTSPAVSYDLGSTVEHWNYTEDKTLTPNWTANTYTITYYDEDGATELTGLTPTSYTYGTGATVDASPIQAHSTFNGWCDMDGTNCALTRSISDTATGDKSFKASWSCATGYTKYSYDMNSSCEFGSSSCVAYVAGSCAPIRYHINCNGNGGVACLEQFKLTSDAAVGDYHFGAIYNSWGVANTEFNINSAYTPVASTGASTPSQLYLFTKGTNNNYEILGTSFMETDLLAAYTANSYTSFLEALAAKSYNSGISFGREHYTFNGLWTAQADGEGSQYVAANGAIPWTGNSNSTDMQTFINSYTSDVNVWAHWTPDVYTILLDAEGHDGTLPAVYETYNTGWSQTSAGTPGAWVQLTAAQMASKPGYTLLGYYSTASGNGTKYINGDGTLVSGVTPTTFGESTTLHARFQADTYNVTYLCGTGATGTAPAATTATYDAGFTPASVGSCTNPGRSFAGWLVSDTSDIKQAGTEFTWQYTEDKTFTAQWTDNTYTITFHPGDDATTTGTTEVQEWYSHAYRIQPSGGSMSWTAITEITLPTKTGYTFAGYYDNSSFTGNPVMADATLPVTTPVATYFTADADLYAKWTANTYDINYVFNGGSAISSDYMPVEYIQGNGSSYINTNVSPASNFELYLDIMILSGNTANSSTVFGTNASTTTGKFISKVYSSTLLSSCVTGQCTSGGIKYDAVNKRVRVGLSPHWIMHYTGTKTTVERSYTSSSAAKLQLLSASSSDTNGKARIYLAEMYDATTSTLQFRGVPVRRKSDGVCGLYNMVNGVFLTSATSTPFSCPDVEYQYADDYVGNINGYPSSYTYGVGANITGVPTRANSTFVGWCENSGLTNNCVTPQNVSATAMGDKTFYAKWTCNAGYTGNAAGTACEPNTITLTYNNGGHGTAPTAPASCVYGENVNLPAAISVTGYTFNKWAVAGNNFAANASVVCNSANLGVTSGTAIITATWMTDSITCAETKYLPAGATVCVDCIAGAYCPGGTFAFDENNNQGITVCATNKYSNAAAASCTDCMTANGYTNSGSSAANHAYESSCKTTCAVGQCVATARAACANVGTTGWATGGVVSQGNTLACNACANGASTCGYGTCADEAGDCGRVLHVGENQLYLRSDRKTDRTLNVKIGNNTYYANMSTANLNMSNDVNKSFKVKVGNTIYSVYDDSVAE